MAFDHTKPIPSDHRIGDWANKYRFGEMDVGDSVYVGGWNDGDRLRRAAAAYRQRNQGWRYRARREGAIESGVQVWGMRVWRIE